MAEQSSSASNQDTADWLSQKWPNRSLSRPAGIGVDHEGAPLLPGLTSTWIDWRTLAAQEDLTVDKVPTILRKAMNGVWLGRMPWPLVILGEDGAGKTCASLLMLQRSRTGGYYTTCDVMCERVRQAKLGTLQFGGYSHSLQEVWSDWMRAMFVVLDEIGYQDVSAHHYEVVKSAIDYRHKDPLVVISNQPLSELAQIYDDQIASRLSMGTIVNVRGDQRRKQGVRM